MDIARKHNVVLKQYQVNVEVFYRILEEFAGRVRIVPDLDPFYKGYEAKREILFDGDDKLICLEHILDFCTDFKLTEVESWRQCVVRCVPTVDMQPVLQDVTGTYAWTTMNRRLEKYYTKEEIDKCLKKHAASPSEELQQYHYNFPNPPHTIVDHPNSYVYDINGAHADALKEIFPKAADEILEMFHRRKEHRVFKAIMNYYVGMLTRKGYRDTYNWIVQRTTKKLFKAMDYCGGILVYANTDGFVVSNPKKLLKPSAELGDYKCEYIGIVYTYTDKNYIVMQYGDAMKGNLRRAVRDRVDLRKGRVVHYDIIRKGNIQTLANIQEEVICQNE